MSEDGLVLSANFSGDIPDNINAGQNNLVVSANFAGDYPNGLYQEAQEKSVFEKVNYWVNERYQYHVSTYLGPSITEYYLGLTAGPDNDQQAQAQKYASREALKDLWNTFNDAASQYKTIVKDSSKVGISRFDGPLLASNGASDIPLFGGDYFSGLRLSFCGDDNPDVANRDWGKFVNTKLMPGVISWGQLSTKILLGGAGIPLDFAFEVESQMYLHYDNPQYSLTQGILDAGKIKGIDLGSDLSAKGVSFALAKAFNLPDSVRSGLEKTLSLGFKWGGEKVIDNLEQQNK